jgi:hypothetical protein
MSFKAILKIDGKKFNLLQASYNFSRYMDPSGYGTNMIRFEQINLLLPSYADIFFLHWMFTPAMQKSGSISFYEDEDRIRKVKRVVFAGAFCIGFKEVYHSLSSMPMHTLLTISAGGVKIEESVFRFPWFKGSLIMPGIDIMNSVVELTESAKNKVVGNIKKTKEINVNKPFEDVSISPGKKPFSEKIIENKNLIDTVIRKATELINSISRKERGPCLSGISPYRTNLLWKKF